MQPSELRVGVTGQRALDDEARVSHAVHALIDVINRTWDRPDAAPLAWTVVSALAAGSDCLVAEAVLEQPGARLEAITPFPLAEYRKDFTSPRDRERLERLLRRAAIVDELDASGSDSEFASGDRDAERDRAYLRVGEEVVRRCDLLIAIWNGRRAAGLGGTGDIVAHALKHQRIVPWIDANQPERPVGVIRSIAYPVGDVASVVSDPLPIDRRGWNRR